MAGRGVEELLQCRRCPRLVGFRQQCAEKVPPRFRLEVQRHGFWARPVPGFGDPQAFLAIVGLAPAAYGANRTGRMFTGDRSGDFLYAALHRFGLASQGHSRHRGDGLQLRGVFVTAALRCAPPKNRPLPEELRRCLVFLAHDLASLSQLRVILALGRIAHQAALAAWPGPCPRPKPVFGHGREWSLGKDVVLVNSYHVSQQNTFTGRLTAAAFDRILHRCLQLAGRIPDGSG
ncbi:MAG: uracil-DNA glycosylase [Thermoanaerobaculum sp.]|nr:uracil-DNA glycosylase [Thermoanaerobaculum sp.]